MIVVKAACTLTRTGQVEIGVHVFEVMLEDYPTKNITLTHADGRIEQRDLLNGSSAPLCRVKLQFSVEGETHFWFLLDSRMGERSPTTAQTFVAGEESECLFTCFLRAFQSFLQSQPAVRSLCSGFRLHPTAAFFTLPWVRSSGSLPRLRRTTTGTCE